MFDLTTIETPDLSAKTILVTGAGRGIGAVLAGQLASAGANVYAGVFSDPNPIWAAHLKDTKIIKLNVTRQQDVDHAIARIGEESGRLDALVNNAGLVTPIGHMATQSTDSMQAAFDVNVLGVHRVTRACLSLLKEAGGVVIVAGTGAATTPMEGWASYCSSKAAARMMTQMFALELKDSGVQFFFMGIPPTDTAMQSEIRNSRLNPVSQIPRADLVAPSIPASAAAWLCGTEARNLDEVVLDVRQEPFLSLMGKS